MWDWSILCERADDARLGGYPDMHIGQSRSLETGFARTDDRAIGMDIGTGKTAEVRTISGITSYALPSISLGFVDYRETV